MFKLVRDKIPKIMLANGQNPVTKVAEDDAVYVATLYDKLLEEVHEFIEAATQNDEQAMRELADVLEVIETICQFKKYQVDLIQNYKANKKRERGGFEKRILLLCSPTKKN
jgi:predicted house-cleaning noncanonical NTP pyrophosphatase (MazG superfamily)